MFVPFLFYFELWYSSPTHQDPELLLQEHCVYRCAMVVPNLFLVEFKLVRSNFTMGV